MSTTSEPMGTGRGPLVLWYTPVSDMGGVARHVLDAARTGIPGFRLVVLCPEGPLAEALRTQGTAVVTGPVGPESGAPRAIREVRRVLARLRPAILHTHLAFADIAGTTAATGMRAGDGSRLRVVSTEHGIGGDASLYQSGAVQTAVKANVHRARLHRTDRVIAVSRSTKEQIERQWGTGAPITIVHNGIDPLPAAPPRAGLRILSLSRLSFEKRIGELIVAFALVHSRHPEARLTIAGTGPDEADLRARARAFGVEDVTDLPGFVDAGEALRTHDVVVQLSAWENLSYTLLDAVAAGTGVVATDVGGNAEIVPPRCLVEAQDHEAVAAAIIDQGLHVEHRPAADAAPWASAADMCGQIAGVYREVLG